jgi:DNA polymerase (family 10)
MSRKPAIANDGSRSGPSNEAIAGQLDALAQLLEAQEANPYRVRAYRRAAQTLRELKQPACESLMTAGLEGLRHLPTIGESLSRSIVIEKPSASAIVPGRRRPGSEWLARLAHHLSREVPIETD